MIQRFHQVLIHKKWQSGFIWIQYHSSKSFWKAVFQVDGSWFDQYSLQISIIWSSNDHNVLNKIKQNRKERSKSTYPFCSALFHPFTPAGPPSSHPLLVQRTLVLLDVAVQLTVSQHLNSTQMLPSKIWWKPLTGFDFFLQINPWYSLNIHIMA